MNREQILRNLFYGPGNYPEMEQENYEFNMPHLRLPQSPYTTMWAIPPIEGEARELDPRLDYLFQVLLNYQPDRLRGI
jgi:hypothetical protein